MHEPRPSYYPSTPDPERFANWWKQWDEVTDDDTDDDDYNVQPHQGWPSYPGIHNLVSE